MDGYWEKFSLMQAPAGVFVWARNANRLPILATAPTHEVPLVHDRVGTATAAVRRQGRRP